ncbi:MAG: DUF2064 domain-containing protein [Chitinophagaceae bacterium]|nr:DUF2064 domain-containing protein [Chitinophagaceae bacterium]
MIAKDDSKNKLFLSLLVNEKSNLLKSLGFPVYTSTQQNQSGNNFGERISNAIQQVFELGFKKIIIVGNDCPLLNGVILKKAIHSLQNNEVVIGPDKRGGIYLLGITKEYFLKQAIENLPWQTTRLALTLKEYCKDLHIAPLVLNALNDINETSDIFFFNNLARTYNAALRFLFDFLQRIRAFYYRLSFVAQELALANMALRAPPSICP